MNRYLLNVSYIGSRFRGAQKQVSNKELDRDDPTTVQGRLEMGLKLLKPVNYPYVTVSSRTDTGVHALHSTFHVDLERKMGKPYDTLSITHVLNKTFAKTQTSIRAISTFLVPPDFHCRRALSRTYMYRFAIVPTTHFYEPISTYPIPIEESERCLYIGTNSFDADKLREACKLFEGWHDFRTFMHKGSQQPNKTTKRVIETIELREATGTQYMDHSWAYSMPKCDYKYYNIVIKSSGFLRNQVRRTVGALLAAAQGKVTARDVRFMLEVPSHNSWDPRVHPLPAYGLYLCQVEYSDEARANFKEHLDKIDTRTKID